MDVDVNVAAIVNEVKGSLGGQSSEDEGIFVSQKLEGLIEQPGIASVSVDVQHLQNEGNIESNKISLSGVSPEVDHSDDSEDDVNSRVIAARRKTVAILSDDEENDEGDGLTVNSTRQSVMVFSDEEGDSHIFKKRIYQKPPVDSEDDNSDHGTQKSSPSKGTGSPLPAKPVYQYNSDLYDAEMSDEEEHKPESLEHLDNEEVSDNKNKNKKAQRQAYKDRKNNARTIRSESQRMVRESNYTLPYHKPKQRSLSEFMNRRKKATPPISTSQRSIKMSMKNLETLCLLEQKKKEVEDFYKSDSDHEDPDDEDWTPGDEGPPDKPRLSEEISSENKIKAFPPTESKEDQLEEDNCKAQKIDEGSSLKLTFKVSEDEDLPDLIIQRVARCDVEKDQDQQMGSSDEQNVSDETNAVTTDSADPNKINDSGILTQVSSQEEYLCDEVALDASNTKERIDCNRMNEMQKDNKEEGEKSNDDNGSCNTVELRENDEGNLVTTKASVTDSEIPVLTEMTHRTPKLNKFSGILPDSLLTEIAMSTPKLSLCEGDFIDLNEDKTNATPKSKAGVHELMNRFVKHTNTKKEPKEKQEVNLSIVSKEKDCEGNEKLVASSVVVNLAEEEEKFGDPVPGARMVLLKMALQSKIMEKREKERLRKVKEKQFLDNEQVMQDYHDDGALPDEEELTDQSETEYETESEPEENDIIIKDKKKKKNAYLDDEAEEEDDMDVDEAEYDDNCDEKYSAQENEDSNDTVALPNMEEESTGRDESQGDEQLRLQWDDTQDIKSTPRVTEIPRDSSTLSNADLFTTPSLKKDLAANSSVLSIADLFATQSVRKGESGDKDSMDSSFELFGSVIPAHQPGGGLKLGYNDQHSETDNDPGFLTPLTRSKSSFFDPAKECDLSLPIENTQDLFDTSLADTSAQPSPCPVNLHLTPLKDSQFSEESQIDSNNASVKLKLDFTGLENSQESDELVGLCSGNFSATRPASKMNINDLMGLCSGRFTSQVNEKSEKEFKMPAAFSALSENRDKPSEEDDELLELCSGQFTKQKQDNLSCIENELPLLKDHSRDNSGVTEAENKVTAEPQMIIMSSDEENNDKDMRNKRKKKRRRIIAFSVFFCDDEDAQDAVEYDDEENEVARTTFTGVQRQMKGGIRADFLDQEAELSDEDIEVSEDEEERGEDQLELEEGDLEAYDENELRDQVGRAHLKTLLDSDKREIRLLQEMYLEDGELHGEGRQRQFRWKNVDVDDDDDGKRFLSDNEGEEEDDTEDAAWRKERFEREKFLKDQKEKADQTEVNVFEIGKKTLLRSSSHTTEVKQEPLKESTNSVPTVGAPAKNGFQANPYSILAKRGSFLSRDKNTLARIAEFTKGKVNGVGTAKQSGNFVFQHLSAEEIKEKEGKVKTMNRSQSLPASKRTKHDRSFFSMDPSSQSSSIFSHLL
ncbi:LOW QUALITY PROTEIN: claspin-like [Macrobrachium nipponense]|uniref:LOW QUALITY PROTEIN: claspin-like n=1 Tax=Macrobrachium nipponense TaxID=159736 RepID=UPI0030C8BC55